MHCNYIYRAYYCQYSNRTYSAVDIKMLKHVKRPGHISEGHTKRRLFNTKHVHWRRITQTRAATAKRPCTRPSTSVPHLHAQRRTHCNESRAVFCLLHNYANAHTCNTVIHAVEGTHACGVTLSLFSTRNFRQLTANFLLWGICCRHWAAFEGRICMEGSVQHRGSTGVLLCMSLRREILLSDGQKIS